MVSKFFIASILLVVGCSLTPQQQAKWEELSQDVAGLRTETKALKAERAKLEADLLANRGPAEEVRERLQAIAMRENETKMEIAAAKGQLAELKAAKTSNAVGTGLDIFGNIWGALSPLLIPLLPALAAVGPIVGGVKSGLERKVT